MNVAKISAYRRLLGSAATTLAAVLTDLATVLAGAPPAAAAPVYQITRTLVDENGEAVKLPTLKNSNGAGSQGVQARNGSHAHLRWKFALDRKVPQGESVLLIQRFSERIPDVFRGDDTTTYYEVIGAVNAGATRIAGQPFDDMWCLVRNQRIARWRTATINAEVRAFRATPALSAVITNLFYDPKAHGNQPIYYRGQYAPNTNAGSAQDTPPQLSPGTLLSIKNFDDELQPDRNVLPVNYWRDLAIGAEALDGKWAYETVTGTFRRGSRTASGVKARENVRRGQTTEVGTLAGK